jgi:hypothetical protein
MEKTLKLILPELAAITVFLGDLMFSAVVTDVNIKTINYYYFDVNGPKWGHFQNFIQFLFIVFPKCSL